MSQYLWYCPEINTIEIWSISRCLETDRCTWKRCSMTTERGNKLVQFYFIGEL